MKKLLSISIILFCLLACTSKKPEDIIKKVLNKNPLSFVVDTIRKLDEKSIIVIYQGEDSCKLISLINEKAIVKTSKLKFTANTDINGLKILKDDNDLSNLIVYFETNNKDSTTNNYWNLNKNEIYTKYLYKTKNEITFSDNIEKGTLIAKLFNYEHILDSLIKELSRGKAAKLIKQNAEYKILKDGFLKVNYSGVYVFLANLDQFPRDRWMTLTKNGYITLVENRLTYISFDFTNKAKQYFINANGGNHQSLIIGYVDYLEITGIEKNNDNFASVDANIKYKLSPIGKILYNTEFISKSYKVQMKLFDDGWRIIQ